MEAARFLKRSGLSDVILSRIWDLSDPGGRGCLDKTGMFTALKLVALVQNGKDLSVNSLHLDVPPPKMVMNIHLGKAKKTKKCFRVIFLCLSHRSLHHHLLLH